ncbi:MAG TPA: outer membrane beta-barrel protein, partial [Polyangiaceae bacterium]|nr:outer membrane beta-barrel protein [Polyangiaceae bacterium]
APPPAFAPAPPPASAAPPPAVGALGAVKVGGYVEAFYQWNFARPGNGITNYRGFDNRHNAFTLANAVLGAAWQKGPVSAEVSLQIGHTPNAYYASEPASPGASGAGEASAATTWKYLQQAYLAYRAPLGRGLLVRAGLFLSPFGVEALAVKDSWNWSRSNLFTGLPFYHTGARASYELDAAWSVTAGVYNGWNSVVDNNLDKSVSFEVAYQAGERARAQLLYFGGVERPEGAPEGQPWRHGFDAYVRAGLGERFELLAHGTAGVESGAIGTSRWFGFALAGRYRAADWLFAALRGDYFRDRPGVSGSERATPIFWPGDWVASGTATVDLRPADGLSVRLEFRHDQADVAMYFRPRLGVDAEGQAVPNARTQDTLTLGATAWF